jgi:endonuclease/exonuclease/phosphatase (EEP) superfamily protein YafD
MEANHDPYRVRDRSDLVVSSDSAIREPSDGKPILIGLLGLGLIGVAGAAACAWLAPLHHLFDLVAMFAAPGFASAVVGLGLAALFRRWKLTGGFVVAALVLLLALRPQWFPAQPAAAAGAKPVTVYFANVWVRNRDNAALARSVKAVNADVVALTEIADHHATDLPEILKAYPYRTATAPARYFAGGPRTVIASRYPIEASPTTLQDGLAVGEAIVHAPGGDFRLLAVHLTRPWPLDGRVHAQRDQTKRLARRIQAGEHDQVLIVGDFNATASSAILKRFAREAGVTPAQAIMGTWFHPLPGPFRLAIDNAFTGPGLTVLRRKVGPANGSDHRPIVVTVARAN